jgi:hypothetical protein
LLHGNCLCDAAKCGRSRRNLDFGGVSLSARGDTVDLVRAFCSVPAILDPLRLGVESLDMHRAVSEGVFSPVLLQADAAVRAVAAGARHPWRL